MAYWDLGMGPIPCDEFAKQTFVALLASKASEVSAGMLIGFMGLGELKAVHTFAHIQKLVAQRWYETDEFANVWARIMDRAREAGRLDDVATMQRSWITFDEAYRSGGELFRLEGGGLR